VNNDFRENNTIFALLEGLEVKDLAVPASGTTTSASGTA
jgi:methylenetetrahydrofolate reductase (NADPH)